MTTGELQGIQPPELDQQEEREGRRRGLFMWLLLAFLSLCLLFACGQIASLSFMPEEPEVELGSKMKADYASWGYTPFGQVSPSILLDILEDLKLSGAFAPQIASDCLIPGTCSQAGPTATPTDTETPAGPSGTPTETSTPTLTLTPSLSPTPSSTASTVPTATNTPTPTPRVYPVKVANPSRLDPTLSQTITFTIYVINYGSLPPAELTAVCDLLPAGLSYVGGSANPAASMGTCPDGSDDSALVWTTSLSIPQGGFARFSFEASSNHPNAGQTFTNEVRTVGGNFQTATNWTRVQAYTPTPQAVANGDSYTTDEDVDVIESSPGVLGNDVNGDSASVVATPEYGLLNLAGDGGFSYQPTPDWNGSDDFIYQACASGGTCDNALVSIGVTSVADAPRAADDSYSVAEDGFLSVPAGSGLSVNDFEPDGELLSVNVAPIATPSWGSLSLFSDGSFNYQPTPDYFGSDQFTYQVCDSEASPQCDQADADITVNAVNDPPTAAADSASTNEDTPVVVDVLANDSDPVEGDSLFVNSIQTQASNGSAAVTNAGADVTYTPDADWNGTDSFVYEMCDTGVPSSECDTATVTVTVDPVNDLPTAADDSASTNEDTAVNIDVLANDSLGDDPDLGDGFGTLTIVATPTHGSATIEADNTITYDPDLNWHSADGSDTDDFTYELCDADLPADCDSATAAVLVNAVNDPPVAVDDGTYSLVEDTSLDISPTPTPYPNLLANDSDVDTGDVLTVQTTPAVAPSNGTVTLNADGTFVYTPDADYRGSDSFDYQVCDDGSPQLCDSAIASLEITPDNDVPVATPDSYSTYEDTPLIVSAPGVLDNDTGLGDTPLTLSVSATPPPAAGTVALSDDGSFTFTPALNFNGSTSFSYQITDSGSLPPETSETSAAVVVDITVNSINDAPVAGDDSDATDEDSAISINVVTNDSDVDGSLDLTSIVITSGPSHGSAVPAGGGLVTYTPSWDSLAAGEVQDDSFTYTIDDNDGATSNEATVTISVTGLNDAPIGWVDGTYNTYDLVGGPEGNPPYAPLVVSAPGVLANDVQVDGPGPLTANLLSWPSHPYSFTSADFGLNSDGSFYFNAEDGYFGTDSFTYEVCDGLSACDGPITVSLYVDSLPVPVDDSGYATTEDTSLNVAAPGVLANDTDFDNTVPDDLTPAVASGPDHGSLTLNGDGSFSYTPDLNYSGSDSFTYTLNDGMFDSMASATVSLTINPDNDPPLAVDDSGYSTDEDTTLNQAAPGVLANDTDVDNTVPGDLSALIETQPANGTVVLNADGSFQYVPDTDFRGTDSFTYRANDGSDSSVNPGTVTITVNPTNDVPVADTDSFSTNEDTTLNVSAPGVLDGDTGLGDTPLNLNVVTQPPVAQGTVSLNDDGSFSFTPADDYFGSTSFEYEVVDSGLLPGEISDTSNTALVTITVNPVNDPPVAVDDPESPSVYEVDEDSSSGLNVPRPAGVLINDTDIDNTVPDDLSAILDSGPSNGSLTLNANGGFGYDPDPDFNGTDTFTYWANDGAANSLLPATVTIIVNDVDDSPTANDDSDSTSEDNAVTIDVLANDPMGNNPLPAPGDGVGSVTISAVASNGSTSVNGDFSITYDPDPDWSGSDSFDYELCDTDGDCDTATVSVTVSAVNDVPTANDDSDSTNEDTAVNMDVLANDALGDDPAVGDGFGSLTIIDDVDNGTTSIEANDTITYDPNDDWFGSDSFTYELCDADPTPDCDTALVSITVNEVNDPPIAQDDPGAGPAISTNEDAAVTIDVLANDADGDPDPDPLSVQSVTDPPNGTAANNGSDVTYTPDADFNGSDTFQYTVSDGRGGTDTASVTVTVNAVNDTPTANGDSAATAEDTGVTFDVLANDAMGNNPWPAPGDGLDSVTPTQPDNGTVSVNPDNTLTYDPDLNWSGTDSFTYELCDIDSDCDAATVEVTVSPVNDPPLAVNDSGYAVDEDGGPLSVSAASGVLSNDTDVDNATPADLSAVLNTGPSDGSLTLNSDGSFSYNPDPDFNGSDSFSYYANDGQDDSTSPATVSITVNPTNDPPTPQADDFGTINQGAATTQNVVANDTDPDGESVVGSTVTIDSPPSAGTALPNGDGTISYTHDGGPATSDSFSYQVCDRTNGDPDQLCASATVTVSIRHPVLFAGLSPDSVNASAGEAVTFTAAFGNNGPGTAYGVEVNVSAGSGCSLLTSSPVYNGDLTPGSGGFEEVEVQAPSTPGSSCQVSVTITSSNGIGDGDASELSVPAAAPASFSLLAVFSGGGAAASPTPTATLAGEGTATPTATIESEPELALSSPTPTPTSTNQPATATPQASATTQTSPASEPSLTPDPSVSAEPTIEGEPAASATVEAAAVYYRPWLAVPHDSPPIEQALERQGPWDPLTWLQWLLDRMDG